MRKKKKKKKKKKKNKSPLNLTEHTTSPFPVDHQWHNHKHFLIFHNLTKPFQELRFLSALIKHGKFDPVELRKVLQLLFPTKSSDKIQEMMAKLYDRDKWDSEEEDQASKEMGYVQIGGYTKCLCG